MELKLTIPTINTATAKSVMSTIARDNEPIEFVAEEGFKLIEGEQGGAYDVIFKIMGDMLNHMLIKPGKLDAEEAVTLMAWGMLGLILYDKMQQAALEVAQLENDLPY